MPAKRWLLVWATRWRRWWAGTISPFFPEDQRQLAAFQESKRRQGQDSVYECGLLGKDGQERWFLVSATAILDEQGKFVGSFAMLSDISERKAMELALEESNRRLTELSNTDSLTGIPNRRSFDAVLEHASIPGCSAPDPSCP